MKKKGEFYNSILDLDKDKKEESLTKSIKIDVKITKGEEIFQFSIYSQDNEVIKSFMEKFAEAIND